MKSEIWNVIDELYKLSEATENRFLSEKLSELAGMLELSDKAFYEDQYDHYCDLINPHIKMNGHGMCEITKDSLIPSVSESLAYLLEFWEKNRYKDGIEHP